MRRPWAILTFLFFVSTIFSQVERPRNLAAFDYKTLHWGFTVGVNSMDFAIKRNLTYLATNPGEYLHGDVIGFQPAGFQVNIVSDLRLTDYWNLRFLPGINLGSRQFIYFDPNTFEEVNRMTIGSSFLDFPVILKYRSERVNNYRPYVIGGISYRIDMSSKTSFDPLGDDLILLKRGDFYLEAGFGVDQYLKYFKYSTEIKLAMGLRNMLVEGEYRDSDHRFVDSISKLRSFMVMLNFHFE
jgi:hypothetical protein